MKTLENIGLFLIAIILITIVFPIGFIFSIAKSLLFNGIINAYDKLGDMCWALGISIDRLGNGCCPDLWNAILIKRKDLIFTTILSLDIRKYPNFGNTDETISSVIGRHYEVDNLTKFGNWVNDRLNSIQKNHSIDAIGS